MDDVGVVINTCVAYVNIAVPPLLHSLAAAGVPAQRVHVVVGDADFERDEEPPLGPSYHYRSTYNIDNNGLLWLTQDPRAAAAHKWVFYLHDTCEVHPEFWHKVTAMAREAGGGAADAVMMYSPFSMGMGLYRVAWLKTAAVRDYMATILNPDPAMKSTIKQNLTSLEDTLFKQGPALGGKVVVPATLKREVLEEKVLVYGTDTPRIKEYYEAAGVYKYKANWGQSTLLTTQL